MTQYKTLTTVSRPIMTVYKTLTAVVLSISLFNRNRPSRSSSPHCSWTMRGHSWSARRLSSTQHHSMLRHWHTEQWEDIRGLLGASHLHNITACYRHWHTGQWEDSPGLLGASHLHNITACYRHWHTEQWEDIRGLLGASHLHNITACYRHWHTQLVLFGFANKKVGRFRSFF